MGCPDRYRGRPVARRPRGRAKRSTGRSHVIVRTAYVSTYPPRRCGIATFTLDLATSTGSREIVALHPPEQAAPYPIEVHHRIRRDEPADYTHAARALERCVDVVSIQHEYGIWGGDDGAHVLEFARALDIPAVATLHTVLRDPTARQRMILTRLIDSVAATVVMSRSAATLLKRAYGVDARRVEIIPHGVPDLPLVEPATVKAGLGVEGRDVILSFGLLGQGKGYELALDALPAVVAAHPKALYVIVGATHPNLLRTEGEAYREALVAQARRLGMADHVRFVDRFVGRVELTHWLEAADVFVTPYPNSTRSSPGRCPTRWAPAARSCRPRTPTQPSCWPRAGVPSSHLVLRPPWRRRSAKCSAIMGCARSSVAARTNTAGGWCGPPSVPTTGACSSGSRRARRCPSLRPGWRSSMPDLTTPLHPASRRHLDEMTDPVGIMQHAIGSRPDPAHGYCTDDIARALQVDLLHRWELGWPAVAEDAWRSLRFLVDAFEEATGRFRNFRSVDGSWTTGVASEDSQGRALLALADVIADAPDLAMAETASSLFERALPSIRGVTAIRAQASVLLGCALTAGAAPNSAAAVGFRDMAESYRATFPVELDPEWPWPEPSMTYENALPPRALIVAGQMLGSEEMIDTGLAVLDWQIDAQVTSEGHLSPVGNGWWPRGGVKSRFDQQPIEATALLLASEAAHGATADDRYLTTMERAYGWFLGDNDLAVAVADPERGAGFDGLTPDGVNANEGAESTLMWLIAAEHIRVSRLGHPQMAAQAEPALAGGFA